MAKKRDPTDDININKTSLTKNFIEYYSEECLISMYFWYTKPEFLHCRNIHDTLKNSSYSRCLKSTDYLKISDDDNIMINEKLP